MHQRRPHGTDGSDFSYRMVVDSRYTKVAEGKAKLKSLITTQVLVQIIGAIFTFLLPPKQEIFVKIAIISIVSGLISLMVGEIGRSHSKAVKTLHRWIFSCNFAFSCVYSGKQYHSRGQRSGKLPSTQRMKWRKDSAVNDGQYAGVDLSGGYYDAGDNVKYNFPMSFTTSLLSWSVIEFGEFMDSDLDYAKEAIQWATDYLLKSTETPGVVYAQIGNAVLDHNCWERPEDMDTDRTAFAVNQTHPGSEVSAEIAAALAASSIVFRSSNMAYSDILLTRAKQVFEFADTYQGSYNDNIGKYVCPFYCDYGGYKDELLWAASWLYKASNERSYFDYVIRNKPNNTEIAFNWEAKGAGTNMLMSIESMRNGNEIWDDHDKESFRIKADEFVCSVVPESPSRTVQYSPGGLLFKWAGCNLQNPTAISLLLLSYARYLNEADESVRCGNITVAPSRLISLVKSQVDYILGDNPMNMSYMVGYGTKYPNFIHHRGSTLPSMDEHPERLKCQDGSVYFYSSKPNPNVLVGAIVGGPDLNDIYPDNRLATNNSEPTTYVTAPFVGVLAYFVHQH